MTAKIFDELLLQGVRAGQMPSRNKTARDWYRNKALSSFRVYDPKAKRFRTKRFNEAEFVREFKGDRLHDKFQLGHMYMYYYQPKHKDTLPYYDLFPMVFPVAPAKGGFYAINLHYLPYDLRAKLMDALYTVANNRKYDESTKLKLTYGILKELARFPGGMACFKHYLTSQLRSKLIYIHPTEWDIALFIPCQKFVKASASKVWADSRRSIKTKR